MMDRLSAVGELEAKFLSCLFLFTCLFRNPAADRSLQVVL